MPAIEPITTVRLSDIDTLVFAGGGNRCWWQAGVMDHLLKGGAVLPAQLVGTSAGAAVAAACLTIGPREAMQRCARLFAGNRRLLEWNRTRSGFPRFVHDRLYPLWIGSWMHDHSLDMVRQAGQRLFVALSHPSSALGTGWSLLLASLANLVESLGDRLHPILPRYLGLRQSFVGLHDCATAAEARTLLVAAASAAPMLRPRRIDDLVAFDGGYLDHAGVFEQDPAQRRRTLVLMTRHHPGLPPLFRWNDRLYWQPSAKVPVSVWDCRQRTTVRAAFAHGWEDARRALEDGRVLCG
ncbi:patatin-like phospholipase family protein [Noviherbaspirillum galbum]|uniref:Patatin-like phospholipase family protein n=1 Tax=Noviherbaspirillum galbum TaxID=2709383 RepID=A0A6B3SUB0_9BURK|nr:patatin-like phospholipase family protein [Noviherbaspirillum galbum]NEX64058.1 patatin-like phospholipase family protein [Noviherbaspirillum galbum]